MSEGDHQAMGDASKNPTSLHAILDKSLHMISDHHLPQAKEEEYTKTAQVSERSEQFSRAER